MSYVSVWVSVTVAGMGRCLPLLFSDELMNPEAFSYFTSTSRAARSQAAQREDALAIVALLNECHGAGGERDWIAALRALLRHSTEDAIARERIARARDFILHLISLGRLSPDDIPWSPTAASQSKAAFRQGLTRSRSALAHIKEPKRQPQLPDIALPYPSKRNASSSSSSSKVSPPGFPTRHLFPLFTEGFRHTAEGSGSDGVRLSGKQFCAEYNVMAILYHLLLAFGGLRACEPHHLFLWDVEFDYERGLGANVYLWHPEKGAAMVAPDFRAPRKAYLESIGLVPRTALVGQRHAGWKNLLLDESVPDRGQRTRVFWVTAKAAQLFWLLHTLYVKHVRPHGLKHPYYFACLSKAHFGGPWTLDASGDALERGLQRIGLASDSSRGLCPHAMRHGFEHSLIANGVAPEYRRIALHQQSIISQTAYNKVPVSHVADALAAASCRLRGDSPPDPLSPIAPRPGPVGELSGIASALLDYFVRLLG